MIPLILTYVKTSSLDKLITQIAEESGIVKNNIIQVKPEKEVITVEQVQSLQLFVSQYYPIPYCIVLFDVDLSGQEVQNALLKVLEERSKRFLFILCVQNYYSLVSTIRSRCRAYQNPSKDERVSLENVTKYDTPLGLYAAMNAFSSFSQEEVLSVIDNQLRQIPSTGSPNKEKILKHLLHIRQMILMHNMNHILGLDSVLIFLSEEGTIKS